MPLPGCSGVRRENTNSKFAPAFDSGSSLSAAPPARSSIDAVHKSTLLTFSVMVISSLSVARVYARLRPVEPNEGRSVGKRGAEPTRIRCKEFLTLQKIVVKGSSKTPAAPSARLDPVTGKLRFG